MWYRYFLSSTKQSTWNSLITILNLEGTPTGSFLQAYLTGFISKIKDWGKYNEKNIVHNLIPIPLAILYSHLLKREFQKPEDNSKLPRREFKTTWSIEITIFNNTRVFLKRRRPSMAAICAFYITNTTGYYPVSVPSPSTITKSIQWRFALSPAK